MEEIHYEQLFYVTGEGAFQERIFEKIILVFLGDSDGRVRNAAAHALAKFVMSYCTVVCKIVGPSF